MIFSVEVIVVLDLPADLHTDKKKAQSTNKALYYEPYFPFQRLKFIKSKTIKLRASEYNLIMSEIDMAVCNRESNTKKKKLGVDYIDNNKHGNTLKTEQTLSIVTTMTIIIIVTIRRLYTHWQKQRPCEKLRSVSNGIGPHYQTSATGALSIDHSG